MPTQTEDTCSCALFGAKRGIPLGPIFYDRWNGRERFTVIDDCWATIQANCSRERWLQSRVTTPALQRFHQSALFPTDVSARPSMQNHVKGKIAAQNVLAKISSGICLFD